MKCITRYSVELIKDKTAMYDIADKKIRSPYDAHTIFEMVFSLSTKPQEHLVMLCLNTKNEVIGAHTIHVGIVNACFVSPRDILQRALLNNATSIMIAHNHPSQDKIPSKEDLDTTERLISACNVVGVQLLDHLIIVDNDFYSIHNNHSDLF